MIKTALIGCGPHATHFYLPAIKRLYEKGIEISLIIDIKSQESFIRQELKNANVDIPTFFLEPFTGNTISGQAQALLDGALDQGVINAVIISTDPLNHQSYAKWALQREIPILMDKPVTTRLNAITDPIQAAGIWEDYLELAELRDRQKKKPPFILCAHRRYHPGIQEVRRLIYETSRKTGCPVTNIQSSHSDGQWRLPYEICTQKHHSYNQGHGKISHSGFHFIDCVVKFWQEGLAGSGKTADQVEVFSSFINPQGLLKQLNRENYRNLFGSEYENACPLSDDQLAQQYKEYGEIDADIVMSLKQDGVAFSHASLNLLHNGFARRSWLVPGRDLYKGNGRVKHERHVVHLGPFMCIQVYSYQSKDDHAKCNQNDDAPGGNNHYEIWVYRNSGMIGSSPVEKIMLHDLPEANEFSPERLYITQVKERSLEEWIEAIHGNLSESQQLSPFSDHAMSVRLMAAIYQSWNLRIRGDNPLYCVPWMCR